MHPAAATGGIRRLEPFTEFRCSMVAVGHRFAEIAFYHQEQTFPMLPGAVQRPVSAPHGGVFVAACSSYCESCPRQLLAFHEHW